MITIYNNPKGEAYRRLLDVAAAHCPSFVLSERYPLGWDASARKVFDKLWPYLLKKVSTREPGPHRNLSIAYSRNAWIHYYACTPESIEVLKDSADSMPPPGLLLEQSIQAAAVPTPPVRSRSPRSAPARRRMSGKLVPNSILQ